MKNLLGEALQNLEGEQQQQQQHHLITKFRLKKHFSPYLIQQKLPKDQILTMFLQLTLKTWLNKIPC